MMKEFVKLRDESRLNKYAMAWFGVPKAVEELYDLENDPDELHNLTCNPGYREKLEELRVVFRKWTTAVGDMSNIPENEMVRRWWHDKDTPPVTATPVITKVDGGVQISCATRGASVGYRILKAGEPDVKQQRTVQSWDYGILFHMVENGKTIAVDPPWNVYSGETIRMEKGDKLLVNAMRIGYDPATTEYIFPEAKLSGLQ